MYVTGLDGRNIVYSAQNTIYFRNKIGCWVSRFLEEWRFPFAFFLPILSHAYTLKSMHQLV